MVRTNNHWRYFVCRNEVPKDVLDDQFDHLDEDECFDNFFKYRGTWYHTSDFMRIEDENWDGSHAHCAFSGVIIKLNKDGEQYKVGMFTS